MLNTIISDKIEKLNNILVQSFAVYLFLHKNNNIESICIFLCFKIHASHTHRIMRANCFIRSQLYLQDRTKTLNSTILALLNLLTLTAAVEEFVAELLWFSHIYRPFPCKSSKTHAWLTSNDFYLAWIWRQLTNKQAYYFNIYMLNKMCTAKM